MNIFSLLFVLALLGLVVAGATLLIIAIVRKSWRLAWIGILAPGLLFGALLGLLYLASGDDSLKRPVAREEVIGAWSLGDYSLNLAKRDGYAPPPGTVHQLEFRPDNTLRYTTVENYPPRLKSGVGKWEIQKRFGDSEIYEVCLRTATERGWAVSSLQFAELEGHLVLWDYWGDPDGGGRLVFNKQR